MKFRLSGVVKSSVSQVGVALMRFPLALASALTLCVALIILAGRGTGDWEWVCQRLALVAALGVPLGVWIVVACESRAVPRGIRWAAQGVGAGLLAAYYGWLPDAANAMPQGEWWRAGVLLLGLHLGVSISERHTDRAGFWSFNWTLFSRYWAGALYAAVFYAGLALALASAVKLFGFEIEDERYFQLWLAVTFGFHPLFLLAGIPHQGGPAEVRGPSRGLRIFAGGVLLPLVGVYVAILYPYAAKIAVTREWPDGWVAWPVLGLAVIGLLALLLVQPLALAGLRWAEWFAGRWFGRLLVPMAVLLAAAVQVRTGEYGLTESRYAGLVLAAWLAACGLYFGTGSPERRPLRGIPWSLLVLCALLAAGPWGLLAVAERSQLARLDRVLAKHGLEAGGVVAARTFEVTLPTREYDDLRSVIDYLHRRHRSKGLYARLEPWLAGHPKSWTERWGLGGEVLTWLKVERAEDEQSQMGISWTAEDVPMAGFTRATFVGLRYENQFAPEEAAGVKLRLGGVRMKVEMETPGGWLPVDALNAKIRERVFSEKTGAEKKRATLWADIVLPSGEARRIVVLRADGQRARTGKTYDFGDLDMLVLAP